MKILIPKVLNVISIIVPLALAMFIFKRNHKSKANRYLGMMFVCGFFWVLSRFFGDFASSTSQSLIFTRLAFVPPLFIVLFFLYFCFILGYEISTSRTKKFLLTIIPFLFLPFVLTSLNVKSVTIANGMVKSFEPGILYIFLSIYVVLYASLGIFHLLKKYSSAKGHLKMQLKYVAFGGITGFSIGLLFDGILPLLGYGGAYNIYNVGPISATIFSSFVAYAIIKHRLMDIKALVLKSVVYSILVGLIALAYIFIIFYVKRYWEGVINPDIAFIAAGFVIAFGFQPLRRFIQKATDKVFAKGRYDFKEVIGKLSNVLSSSLTEDDVVRPVLSTLTSDLRISSACFVLTSSPEVTQVKTTEASCPSDKKRWDNLSKMIEDSKIVVADELEGESDLKEALRERDIEVLVPLYKEKKNLGGFLALGEKKSGDAYTSEDIKLLEIISPQISIALKNAERQKQLIEQVLEERERIEHDAHDRIYNRLGALAKSCEFALCEEGLMKETLEKADYCLRKTVVDLQEIVQGEKVEPDSSCKTALEELKRVCKEHEKECNQKVSFVCLNGAVEKLSHKDFWHLQCIVQECLNNIRKYAQASNVSVVLSTESSNSQEQVTLQVIDDGKGFDKPTNLDELPEDCHGLRGMKQRAEKMSGIFEVENSENGTQVRVKVPVSKG